MRAKTVERTKAAAKPEVGDETLEIEVQGKTVRVVSRPADGDGLARLFDLDGSLTWPDSSPMSDDEVADVLRDLFVRASEKGEQADVLGVPPAAAMSFPADARISVSPLEPVSFSLPGSPSGLVLQMDTHGDGHLYSLGDDRISLGSDGMWWIVSALIDALKDPAAACEWPRVLVVAGSLGGPAAQATFETAEGKIAIVWRRLRSGVVGDVIASTELSTHRVNGWLRILQPVADDLARNRAHHQRLLPARTAESWARCIERWAV